jgi:hypothetical protein
MRARVALMIASLGPGFGVGLSAKPTWCSAFITNAFISDSSLNGESSSESVPLTHDHE